MGENIKIMERGDGIKFPSSKDLEKKKTSEDEAEGVESEQHNKTLSQNGYPPKLKSDLPSQQPTPLRPEGSSQHGRQIPKENKTASERIATGDSRAIVMIQPGNKGIFTVDFWEVILRIIGYERAANRRSVQNHPNMMII